MYSSNAEGYLVLESFLSFIVVVVLMKWGEKAPPHIG